MPDFVPWAPPQPPADGQCPQAELTKAGGLTIAPLPRCALTGAGPPPAVGSPEWCSCLDQLVEWVSQFGDSAFKWLFDLKEQKDEKGFWEVAVNSISAVLWNPALGASVALPLVKRLDGRVRAAYDVAKDAVEKSRVCNPAALLGIELLRSILHALRLVRFGTDALVWATVDLSYGVTVLEHVLGYVEGYACPTEIPSWGEIVACYESLSAPEGLLRCWGQMRGRDWRVNYPVLLSARRKPEVQELFTLRNREIINDDSLDKQLRHLGFALGTERALLPDLRYEVPGPSDLVRFAVRHVFEPELISEFGYNDEYRPILDAFHHVQGVDYPIFSGPLRKAVSFTETLNGLPPGTFLKSYQTAGLHEPTWAQAYWWSHWVLPSPSQGYEMFFRLDPTRDKAGEPGWMAQQEFDLDHLRLLLRAQDYPPYWRDKLAAIAYRPPNLRFLRVQLQTHTITHQQAVSQLRQMGFRPDYAESQASALERQIEMQEREKLLRIILKQNEAAWDVGLLTDAEMGGILERAGIPQGEADALFAAAAARHEVERAKALIGELRKSYLRGALSWAQIDAGLTQVGIIPARRAQYRAAWDVERVARSRDVTASQAIKGTVQGLLTLPQLALRLRNLDYSDDAVTLILADVRLRQAAAQAKALKQAAAEARRTQSEHQAVVRAAERLLREARSELARHGSPNKLKTWYCEGSITRDEVTERLSALGWPEADIERLLAECAAKQKARAVPKPARPAKELPKPAHQATAGELVTWYGDGIIDGPTAAAGLRARGYTEDDLARKLETTDAKRRKAGLPTYLEETGQSPATAGQNLPGGQPPLPGPAGLPRPGLPGA